MKTRFTRQPYPSLDVGFRSSLWLSHPVNSGIVLHRFRNKDTISHVARVGTCVPSPPWCCLDFPPPKDIFLPEVRDRVLVAILLYQSSNIEYVVFTYIDFDIQYKKYYEHI